MYSFQSHNALHSVNLQWDWILECLRFYNPRLQRVFIQHHLDSILGGQMSRRKDLKGSFSAKRNFGHVYLMQSDEVLY